MKDFLWKYRKPICYTIGGLNILNGIVSIASGNIVGVIWLSMGAYIVYDAKVNL